MSDLASVLDSLDQVSDLTAQLNLGLRQRQEDLLGLEDRIHDIAGHRHAGLVIVDQAEDVRRSVDSHVELQLLEVRNGLLRAASAIGSASSGADQKTVDLADRIAKEASHAKEDLDAVREALGTTSQALPTDPGLAAEAQRSVDLAAARLENARRAVFQVAEHLPTIIDGVRDAAAASLEAPDGPPDELPVGLDRLTTSVIAEMRQRATRTLTTPEPGGEGPTP